LLPLQGVGAWARPGSGSNRAGRTPEALGKAGRTGQVHVAFGIALHTTRHAQCCLTPRSTADPARQAAQGWPAALGASSQPSLGLPAVRVGVSSNVRPQKGELLSQWHQVTSINPRQYRCGHCGFNVANNLGYAHHDKNRRIYICPNCDGPTYFVANSTQTPGVVPGNDVQHIPTDLDRLYREARNCCAVGANTASVLASRKMLMSIAVQQGAAEGLKFIEYVDYLATSGYIPPNGRTWVDHIRRRGNEATHEIALMSQGDAEELIVFLEMLLKFIYEFPAKVPPAA
jgi:hypothetical protein